MAERDQRKAQRISVELPMQLTLDNGEQFQIKTWDFSANGVYLIADDTIRNRAEVDASVQVQFQGTNYTPPVLSAKIIRITNTGLALQLQETLIQGDAS